MDDQQIIAHIKNSLFHLHQNEEEIYGTDTYMNINIIEGFSQKLEQYLFNSSNEELVCLSFNGICYANKLLKKDIVLSIDTAETTLKRLAVIFDNRLAPSLLLSRTLLDIYFLYLQSSVLGNNFVIDHSSKLDLFLRQFIFRHISLDGENNIRWHIDLTSLALSTHFVDHHFKNFDLFRVLSILSDYFEMCKTFPLDEELMHILISIDEISLKIMECCDLEILVSDEFEKFELTEISEFIPKFLEFIKQLCIKVYDNFYDDNIDIKYFLNMIFRLLRPIFSLKFSLLNLPGYSCIAAATLMQLYKFTDLLESERIISLVDLDLNIDWFFSILMFYKEDYYSLPQSLFRRTLRHHEELSNAEMDNMPALKKFVGFKEIEVIYDIMLPTVPNKYLDTLTRSMLILPVCVHPLRIIIDESTLIRSILNNGFCVTTGRFIVFDRIKRLKEMGQEIYTWRINFANSKD